MKLFWRHLSPPAGPLRATLPSCPGVWSSQYYGLSVELFLKL